MKRLMERLEAAAEARATIHRLPHDFRVLVLYFANHERGLSLKELREKVPYIQQPQTRDCVMTLLEELRAEGEQRGIDRGRAEGRAEGHAEGEQRGVARGSLIGQIQALQRILGSTPAEIESFANASPEQLREQIAELEAKFRAKAGQ